MKSLLIATALAISPSLFAEDHTDNCSSGILIAGNPGVVQCDAEGPDGADNFLGCIPNPTDGSGERHYGPVALKSYKGMEIYFKTTAVDNGRNVRSTIKISDQTTNEVLLSTIVENNSANAWFKINGKAFWFYCRPY